MNIRTSSVFAAASLLTFAVTTLCPITAVAGDGPWQLRVAALSMDPTGNTVVVEETGERIPYGTDNGYGFGIDLEYRASRRLGIDVGVLSASPGVEMSLDAEPLNLSATSNVTITPLYAALNIHLTPDGPLDLYIGPLVAYVFYQDFSLIAGPGLREDFSIRNGFGFGAVLGLDIGLGNAGWSLNTAIRYLDTTLEATSADGGVGRTDIDPIIVSIGAGYRF